MSRLRRTATSFLVVLLLAGGAVWFFFGARMRLEDRTTAPLSPASALEPVAKLEHPPGRVAVSQSGRSFVSFHPRGGSPIEVAELVDGRPVPFPSADFQHAKPGTLGFQSVLGLRIGGQGRLWVLDRGRFGWGQPRLLEFDLEERRLVWHYDLPRAVAPFPSSLNDLAIDPAGTFAYVADAGFLWTPPALIVVDVGGGSSRRVLAGHRSVRAQPYLIDAGGTRMSILGAFALQIGIDAIALDDRGEWLYYGPLSGSRLYRIRTADLRDNALSPEQLGERVENYGLKALNDSLAIDRGGNLYIGDIEQSAIMVLDPRRELRTLVKSPSLRWPSGLAFGPDGSLYVACSAFQDVWLRPLGPGGDETFAVFRLKPATGGISAR